MALTAIRELCDLPYGCAVVSNAGYVHGEPQQSVMFELLTLHQVNDI